MIEQLNVTYDQEGDILSLEFGRRRKGVGVELNEHLLLRIDPRSGRALSLTIFDFSKVSRLTTTQLSGLKNLSKEVAALTVEALQSEPLRSFIQIAQHPRRKRLPDKARQRMRRARLIDFVNYSN